ncbi:MAG: peptidase U32 family protein [bacterium]
MTKPELLAPAGNLEKLKTAFLFGADAVYVGNPVFGLRKYAENFNDDELREGIAFANKRNKQVYVVLNAFAQEKDISAITNYLKTLNQLRPHALIISDIGVLELAKQHTNIPLHISTQASIANAEACQFYQDLGAKRIILAREVSLKECETIQETFQGELELFVHGAMCASYSGRCVISNYTSGRDSNRGGCIQSCRHNYKVSSQTNDISPYNTTLMNAKDLWGIRQLEQLMTLNIASLKIEGRMKSPMYLANVVSCYRKAIDEISQNGTLQNPSHYETQLAHVSNRQFSDQSLGNTLNKESINTQFNGYQHGQKFIGTVQEKHPNNSLIIQVKEPFSSQDTLHLHSHSHGHITIQSPNIQTLSNITLEKANPNQLIKLNWQPSFSHSHIHDILYKKTPSTH